jgi:Splicing factor 1 helix-hairpin domain
MVATLPRPRLLEWLTRATNAVVVLSEVKCMFASAGIHTYSFLIDSVVDGVKRRKKRNRWGDAQENKAAGLMGLPTMIMANMTTEQLEAYTLHLRIEEISQKLRINDVVPADGDR